MMKTIDCIYSLFRRLRKAMTEKRSLALTAFLFFSLMCAAYLYAETELQFERISAYSGTGNEKGYGLVFSGSQICAVGSESKSTSKALVARFTPPLQNVPDWSLAWSDVSQKIFTQLHLFSGAAASDGFYFSGKGMSKNGKQSAGFLAKYPRDLSSASQPNWSIFSGFKPDRQNEVFYDVVANEENGLVYVYVTGFITAEKDNKTALLAKYDANGALVWSRYLGSASKNQKSAGAAIGVLNGFVYVAGYEGAGGKKAAFQDIALNPKIWKYDTAGNEIWFQSETQTLSESAKAFKDVNVSVVVSDSFVFMVGSNAASSGSGNQVFVSKYSEDGTLVWNSQILSPRPLVPFRANVIPPDRPWLGWVMGASSGIDRFYVTGQVEDSGLISSSTNQNAFVLEIDQSFGRLLAMHRYGDVGVDEAGLAIETVGQNVYVSGLKKTAAEKRAVTKKKTTTQTIEDYDLILLEFTPRPVKVVSLDVLPGEAADQIILKASEDDAEESLKGRMIEAAVLSAPDFDAPTEMDWGSVTFGKTGHENNLAGCRRNDVNGDASADLLCTFQLWWEGPTGLAPIFSQGDTEAILRGQLLSGDKVLGKAAVTVSNIASAKKAPVSPASPAADSSDSAAVPLISGTGSNSKTSSSPVPVLSSAPPPQELNSPLSSSETSLADTEAATNPPQTIEPEPTTPLSTESVETPTSSPTSLSSSTPDSTLTETSLVSTTEFLASAPLSSSDSTALLSATVASSTADSAASSPEVIQTSSVAASPVDLTQQESASLPALSTSSDSTVSAAPAASDASASVSADSESADTVPAVSTSTTTSPTKIFIPLPTAPVSITTTATAAAEPSQMDGIQKTVSGSAGTSAGQESFVSSYLRSDETRSLSVDFDQSGIAAQDAEGIEAAGSTDSLAGAYYDFGNELLTKGDYERAIGNFLETLRLHPKFNRARKALGYAFYRVKKFKEAIRYYEEAVRENPDSAELRNLLGLVLFEDGRMDEAAHYFEEALKLDPNHEPARKNLEAVRSRKAASVVV